MRFAVEVTERDIRTGLAYDPRMCPIAKAVRRATHRRYVRVDGGIQIGDPESTGGAVLVPLNEDANKFIRDFDYGDPVKPFGFLLELEPNGG